MLNAQNILGSIKSFRGNGSIAKVCKKCGIKFATQDSNVELCLRCIVIKDMHLPEDTIINGNIMNMWRKKQYNPKTGLEPIFRGVCEGVIVLDEPVRKRNHLTGYKRKKQNVPNEKIENYIKSLIYRSNGKYDAIVVVRFGKSGFSVFCLKYSEKTFKRIKKKNDHHYEKQTAINLVMKHELKSMKYN